MIQDTQGRENQAKQFSLGKLQQCAQMSVSVVGGFYHKYKKYYRDWKQKEYSHYAKNVLPFL